MKDFNDRSTVDILSAQKKRGRPVDQDARSDAERKRIERERLREWLNQLSPMEVKNLTSIGCLRVLRSKRASLHIAAASRLVELAECEPA